MVRRHVVCSEVSETYVELFRLFGSNQPYLCYFVGPSNSFDTSYDRFFPHFFQSSLMGVSESVNVFILDTWNKR